jgi:hypothetical protein
MNMHTKISSVECYCFLHLLKYHVNPTGYGLVKLHKSWHSQELHAYRVPAVQLNTVKALLVVSNGIPTRELTKLKFITTKNKSKIRMTHTWQPSAINVELRSVQLKVQFLNRCLFGCCLDAVWHYWLNTFAPKIGSFILRRQASMPG